MSRSSDRFADANHRPVDDKHCSGGKKHLRWQESRTRNLSGIQDRGVLFLTVSEELFYSANRNKLFTSSKVQWDRFPLPAQLERS